MQMHQLDARVRKIKADLNGLRVRKRVLIENIETAPRGSSEFVPFPNGGVWATTVGDNWQDFRFTVTVPEDFYGQAALTLRSGRESDWEAVGPQIVVWVNGKIEQAFDTRHLDLILSDPAVPGKTYEIFMQAYFQTQQSAVGVDAPRMTLYISDIMDDVSQLYYDLYVPH